MTNHNEKTGSSANGFIAGVFFLALGVFPSLNSEIHLTKDLTNDEVGTIIKNTVAAFDLAETKILEVKPDIPDDTPDGPHPDVNKCVCRGTGKITHGDGHQTDCPYHGKDVVPKPEPPKPPKPKPKPEPPKPEPPKPEPEKCTGCKCDTNNTYCNCIKVYGKCSCQKTKRILDLSRG
tara:strand:- start:366 stop:896 length:531 start_codon:yes stop_codon:yes gene_type:complete